MSILQPSPFWRVTRKLWSLRALLALGIIAVCLELVARSAPIMVGKQVHQRYLYTSYTSNIDDTTLGKQITWVSNGRGARGDLYHGQPIEIAVFGSSTSEDYALDQNRSWAQQLKLQLGSKAYHVDNYARNDSYHRDALAILEELARTGKHYDVVLLMVLIDRNVRPPTSQTGFHYWAQWARREWDFRFFEAASLLPRRLSAQVQSEDRLRTLREWIEEQFRPPQPPSSHPRRSARSNRVLRAGGKVRLQYASLVPDEEDRKIIREETRRTIETARRVADKVMIITQPMAYDENELPGVAERWYSLYPIEGEDAYQDNLSVAESLREATDVMVEVAESMGAPVIDLDNYMRPQLRERDDLFFDKWHFSEAGAEVAAGFVARALRQQGVSAKNTD
jgi:lysophospholipase L1-like esterase